APAAAATSAHARRAAARSSRGEPRAGSTSSLARGRSHRHDPYHAIQTATSGSRWQRCAPDQAIFAALEDGTFASSCAPSVPYLFHANRPKNGPSKRRRSPRPTEELSREARGYE